MMRSALIALIAMALRAKGTSIQSPALSSLWPKLGKMLPEAAQRIAAQPPNAAQPSYLEPHRRFAAYSRAMELLFDFVLLAPRRLRTLFPIALIAAIHFFPGPTEALFWARVKAEAQQVTSMLRTGIGATLRQPACAQAHHCRR